MIGQVPFWAKALLFVVRMLPIPAWIKLLVEAVIYFIDRLPEPEKSMAKAELKAAVKTRDAKEIERVAKKICYGVGCPPDTKGE